jgi:hypothetical protein
MIRRILCPTDLTENSRDSVAYALRLASENAAELVIFHATGFPNYDRYFCELELYSQSQWQEWVSRFKMDQILADAERKVKSCRRKIQSRGRRRRMEAQSRARQSLRGDHRGSFPGGGRSYCDGPRQQKHGRTAIKKQHYGIGEQGRAVSGSFYRYNSVCRPFCWVEGASVEGVFSNLLSGTKRAGSIGRCTR